MQKFLNFIYYNIFVYVIYLGIDTIFDSLNLYSNHNLGTDLMIMPTSSDLVLIGINIVLSLTLGLVVLKKVQAMRDDMNT